MSINSRNLSTFLFHRRYAGLHTQELRETNELLRLKITKLEQLVRLKDAKILRLTEAAELGSVLP